MIGYLEGKLAEKEPTRIIVDLGGIGYEVHISLNTYGDIKDIDSTKLFTYLHVKEDSHTLYGFSTTAEKDIFLKLISISGIGPSTGIVITSFLSVDEIKSAIVNEDVKVIQGVKGIGAKTAQRVILELKDKLHKEGIEARIISPAVTVNNTLRQEALSALMTLGIQKGAAEKSIDAILAKSDQQISLEELIKTALKRA
jgi:Holliday junction DNA helicase RuvA